MQTIFNTNPNNFQHKSCYTSLMAIHRELGKCLTDFLMSFSRLLRIYHHCNNWDIIILSIHRVVDWLYSFKHFLQRRETCMLTNCWCAFQRMERLQLVYKQQNAVFIGTLSLEKEKGIVFPFWEHPVRKTIIYGLFCFLWPGTFLLLTKKSPHQVVGTKIPTYCRVF